MDIRPSEDKISRKHKKLKRLRRKLTRQQNGSNNKKETEDQIRKLINYLSLFGEKT